MRAIIAVYAASVVYAVIRYVVFAPRNLEQLPVFVINKGVSMAAAICFVLGFRQAWRSSRGAPIETAPSVWFRAGVFGAIWHIPMSLAILRPAYFKEFFHAVEEGGANPKMTFAGEMVFLFGGLTAAMIFLLARASWAPSARRRLSLGFMAILLTHVLAMGYSRGLNINATHAYLPPMWLLSAGAALLGLWWAARAMPEDARPGGN